jgi:hypothetical protein
MSIGTIEELKAKKCQPCEKTRFNAEKPVFLGENYNFTRQNTILNCSYQLPSFLGNSRCFSTAEMRKTVITVLAIALDRQVVR